jgi:hypothetical protein
MSAPPTSSGQRLVSKQQLIDWIASGEKPKSAWRIGTEHEKFLFELGTHRGYSYLAFCQAVQRLGLETRCFAVDTWQGEEHAGRYDDSIWQEYSAYHRQHFAGMHGQREIRLPHAKTMGPDFRTGGARTRSSRHLRGLVALSGRGCGLPVCRAPRCPQAEEA